MSQRTVTKTVREAFSKSLIMFPVNSEENVILKELITKYPLVFPLDDSPPSVTPHYFHTIHLQSTPKSKKTLSFQLASTRK